MASVADNPPEKLRPQVIQRTPYLPNEPVYSSSSTEAVYIILAGITTKNLDPYPCEGLQNRHETEPGQPGRNLTAKEPIRIIFSAHKHPKIR